MGASYLTSSDSNSSSRRKHPFTLLFCALDFCSFLEVWFEKFGSRKVVLQTWIFFFCFEKSGWPEKKGGFIIQIHLFFRWRKVVLQTRIFFWFKKSSWPEKIRVYRTTFLKPLFYTFVEKWLQIKWPTGCFLLNV